MEDGLCRKEICSSPLRDQGVYGLITGIELKQPPTSSACHIGIFSRGVWWGLGNSLHQKLLCQ
jgi:hypothetical protein